MDLFKIKYDESRLHDNYKVICGKEHRDVRETLNHWIEGFIDRDEKFIDEFQLSFNSSFWELYCFAVLKEMGKEIDFSYSAPDFVIKKDKNIEFSLECTIASNPKDGVEENNNQEKLYPSMKLNEMIDLSTIRMLNSITSKCQWVQKNKVNVNLKDVISKSFILALAPFDQPHFQVPNLQSMVHSNNYGNKN